MVSVINLPAIDTGVATIHGDTGIPHDGRQAIERLDEVLRDLLQFPQLISREQVSVPKSTALEASLQQLNAGSDFSYIRECHFQESV
jgi:hypothetical protein